MMVCDGVAKFLGKQIIHKSRINVERLVLIGRPLFGKEATVGKLKGLMGLGNPNDIANACIYLLSDASRWVTGSNLVVDGGVRRGEVGSKRFVFKKQMLCIRR